MQHTHDRRRLRRAGSSALGTAGALLTLMSAGMIGVSPVHADTTTTQSFSTPGGHLITIPAGVTTIHVVAVGGSGGSGSALIPDALKTGAAPTTTSQGGDGARVVADVAVTPGENLCAFVNVGGGNGVTQDSNDTSGAGGGETDLRTTPDTSPTCDNSTPVMRLLAAGGGGGGPIPLPIIPSPGAPKSGLSIATYSVGGHAGWGSATPGNLVAMPQPCAAGAAGTAGGGATDNDQGGAGTCIAGGAAGGMPTAGNAGGQATGGDGREGEGAGGGGGGGAGLFGGGGGASDQSSGGAGGGGASCAPCVIAEQSTSTSTVTLDAWRQSTTSIHTTAMLKPGAMVGPAGGAAPVFTLTATAVVVIPPVAAAGSAGPLSAWQPALLVTGIVLVGFAGILRRRDSAGH